MTPKIEKGIPLPEGRTRTGTAALCARMEVGDSIFFKGIESANLCSLVQRLKPMKFTVRTVDLGTRIWRIQ